jgi:hypothetical protein
MIVSVKYTNEIQDKNEFQGIECWMWLKGVALTLVVENIPYCHQGQHIKFDQPTMVFFFSLMCSVFLMLILSERKK